MKNPSASTFIEDSTGYKYFFYYNDSSIFLREASSSGVSKETMLINQVTDSFLVTADETGNLYLVCYSKYKGIITLVHSDESWRLLFSPVTRHVSSAVLLDAFAINGSIHIIYAAPLPLVNFYSLHHLYNNDDLWQKETLPEIYAENIRDSYNGALTADGSLEFACLRFDGKEYYVNLSTFDCKEKKWLHSNIVNLFDKNIKISFLKDIEKSFLVIYTNDEDTAILFTFEKSSSETPDFEFISLNRVSNIPEDSATVFSLREGNISLECIADSCYFKYIYDAEQKDWCLKKRKELPKELAFSCINSINMADKWYKSELLLSYLDDAGFPSPLELAEFASPPPEPVPEEKEKAEESVVTNMDDFIPYLVEQIKSLSENIKIINQKLNNSETQNIKRSKPPESTAVDSNARVNPQIKSSNFRDKFMSSGTSFNGFKQTTRDSNPVGSSAGPAGGTYSPKTSFKENFISSDTFKNGSTASVSFYGSSKYAMSANENEGFNKNFITHNEDAADTQEAETASPPKDETDIKKANSILKKIGDFFK